MCRNVHVCMRHLIHVSTAAVLTIFFSSVHFTNSSVIISSSCCRASLLAITPFISKRQTPSDLIVYQYEDKHLHLKYTSNDIESCSQVPTLAQAADTCMIVMLCICGVKIYNTYLNYICIQIVLFERQNGFMCHFIYLK